MGCFALALSPYSLATGSLTEARARLVVSDTPLAIPCLYLGMQPLLAFYTGSEDLTTDAQDCTVSV